MDSIVQTLRPIFFVMFFVGTALAYFFRDRFHLRQIHLTVFFTCLVLVSLVGSQFLPVVTLHKFVQEGPQERTEYEIRAVDTSGNELLLDARAIDPVPASRITVLGERMAYEYDRKEREAAAKYILDQSRAYRTSIESGPPVRFDRVEFPRHGFGFRWDANALSEYSEFVAVRVYEVGIAYSEDGTEVVSRTESLAYEYSEDGTESVSDTESLAYEHSATGTEIGFVEAEG